MKIEGKVALVTGGASGMGEAVCRHLASKGASVLVVDRDPERAATVAQSISGKSFGCDVRYAKDVEHLFSLIAQTPLSIAINCAGVAPAKRMVGKEGVVPLSWFEDVIDINLVGTFNIMRMAVSHMMKNEHEEERGVIINTASIAAFEGQIGQTAYSASKAGIVGMTLPAARECAKWGIRVMTIAPGLIDTPMMQGFTSELKEALIQDAVFPKRLGKASEFSGLVEHIIENPLLNGEVIRLDGGVRLR